MKFADGITNAYDTYWSYVNSFRVEFFFTDELIKKSGWNNKVDGENINLNIISINTPQFTNSNIEQFVANRWVVHNGRDELYRFTITFRDRDSMDLYRKFVAMYNHTKNDYFDNVAFSVFLYKDADYYDEEEQKLFEFNQTMIESVSQLDFNTTIENQIAEFTVSFKTISPYLQKAI